VTAAHGAHAAASVASAATPSPAAPHSAASAAFAAASCSHRTPESYTFRVRVFVFPLTVIESKSAQFQGQNGRHGDRRAAGVELAVELAVELESAILYGQGEDAVSV
jgi:hypothetical protein